ncbi:hypothetical protein K438DRAFT_1952865 [Mycena galopus ATCC 62051]|nr:hypothetical protein K438DRAFT_1952865 [Mycena galopus ATCC 62051]
MSDNNTQMTDGNIHTENSQYQKHSSFWKNNGSIVVRVDERTIYRIHQSMLEELSDVMNSIFSIPNNKALGDPTREGSEKYPLYIPGTSVTEFDDFLMWLYRTQWIPLGSDSEEHERICKNLLKLAHKWEIEPAKTHAIATLETMVIPPSRHLQLARRFSISHWVEPAVKEIFEQRITALTNFDVEAMASAKVGKLCKPM